ncbi:MAG: dihydrolipoamide succinyltransferase, partial [Rhizobiales bacterium]|nr:dihydrolipoamide succinyltransferase [Hyphomicrobiales bacterium]
MAVEVRVPTLGESVTEATVANWFKQPGDAVKADEMLCELETDKVTIEVPAPAAGVMGDHVAKSGDTVGVDALLATIEEGAGAPAKKEEKKAEKPAEKPAEDKAVAKDEPAPEPKKGSGRDDVEDAPSAKKAMAEAGISADDVKGTGRDGRVMKEDVQKAIAAASAGPSEASAAPASVEAPRAPVAEADEEREKRVRMTRLRQTIARRLKDAQNTAAMLTTYNEVDMGAVMELRNEYRELFLKKHGVKLGFMSFFTKACCQALKEWPAVNASIDGEEIIYHDYCDVSIAVSTPKG